MPKKEVARARDTIPSPAEEPESAEFDDSVFDGLAAMEED